MACSLQDDFAPTKPLLCQSNFMEIIDCHKVAVNLATLSFGDIAEIKQ